MIVSRSWPSLRGPITSTFGGSASGSMSTTTSAWSTAWMTSFAASRVEPLTGETPQINRITNIGRTSRPGVGRRTGGRTSRAVMRCGATEVGISVAPGATEIPTIRALNETGTLPPYSRRTAAPSSRLNGAEVLGACMFGQCDGALVTGRSPPAGRAKVAETSRKLADWPVGS